MMKKTVLVLFCIALCLFACAACDGLTSSGTKTDPNKKQDIASKDGSLQVTVPGDWAVIASEDPDDYSFQYANKEENCFIFAIIEDKMDFDSDMDLNEYFDIIYELLEDDGELKNLVFSPKVNTTIGGHPAILIEYSCTISSINFVYWNYFFETDKYFMQLLGASLKSKASDNESLIKEIVQTIKVK
jgi:hypothetical protein